MPPLEHVVTLSSVLFTIGVVGVMTRRNLIVMMMSIELMLNAVNLALVAFNRMWPGEVSTPELNGQVFVLIIIAVAAAEVAVGLAILISLFRVFPCRRGLLRPLGRSLGRSLQPATSSVAITAPIMRLYVKIRRGGPLRSPSGSTGGNDPTSEVGLGR